MNIKLYIHSDGKIYRANAQVGGNQQIPAVGIAIESVSATGGSDNIRVLVKGLWYSAAHGLTLGSQFYLGEADGAITSTKPTDVGDVVQVMGIPLNANVLYVNVSMDYITV